MYSAAGGVKKGKSAHAFSPGVDARQHVVTDLDRIVLYTRLSFREVKDIRFFIIVVRKHGYMLYFFRFLGKICSKDKWSRASFDDNSEPPPPFWEKTITDDR